MPTEPSEGAWAAAREIAIKIATSAIEFLGPCHREEERDSFEKYVLQLILRAQDCAVELERERLEPTVNPHVNGLMLPCSVCRLSVAFDYFVDDDFWARYAPVEHRRSVVCLPCLDATASAQGGDVTKALRLIYFTSWRGTVPFVRERERYRALLMEAADCLTGLPLAARLREAAKEAAR